MTLVAWHFKGRRSTLARRRDALERGAESRRQRHRALRVAVDIDVHEMTLRGGKLRALREDADLVAHRGGTDAVDDDADLDGLGEGEGGEIGAAGLDHEADDGRGHRLE